MSRLDSQRQIQGFIRVQLGLLVGFFSMCFLVVSCTDNDEDAVSRGSEMTDEFVGLYKGQFAEQGVSGESIEIDKNGAMVLKQSRDVGHPDLATVPPNTTCSYTFYANILKVLKLNDGAREKLDRKSGNKYMAPQTHEINFMVTKAVWDKSDSENKNCKNFIKMINSSRPRYTYPVELIDNNQMRFHTKGGSDFTGQEKTGDVLDELYVRVPGGNS